MGNFTIRRRMTLWFLGALILLTSAALVLIWSLGTEMSRKGIRDTLVETVTRDVEAVRYISDPALNAAEDPHYSYVEYKDGLLEIDNDFLVEVNGVYASLYTDGGKLLYGKNPVETVTELVGFDEENMQTVPMGNSRYYVYDQRLSGMGLDNLILRGVVPLNQGTGRIDLLVWISVGTLPLLAAICLVVCSVVLGRAMAPAVKLSKTAEAIEKSGDLSRRTGLGEGNDELHQLGKSMDRMLEALNENMEEERAYSSGAAALIRPAAEAVAEKSRQLLSRTRSQKEYVEGLTEINRQSAFIVDVLSDMEEAAKLQKSSGSSMQQLDLSRLTEQILQNLELPKDRNISVEKDLAADVEVRGDRTLLEQAILELLHNAAVFGRKQGEIHVRLTSGKKSAVLEVADNGAGIPREDLDRIFQRLYKSDNRSEGNGMGLYLARRIAELHRGTLTVRSEYGKGSTFILTLPLDAKRS